MYEWFETEFDSLVSQGMEEEEAEVQAYDYAENSGIEQQAVFKTFLHTTSGLLRKKLMMSYANAFCRLIRMNAWILNYLLLMLKTLL